MVLPLTPHLLCTSLSILRGRKASCYAHGWHYGVRTLGRSRPRSAGLVPRMGNASVSNISASLGFVVVEKPLLRPVCRLWLARLRSFPSPPPGSVRWHRYCPFPPPGWHPTAPPPLAGTLLLHSGWHPTAHPRWLASPLPGGSARLLPSWPEDPSSLTPSRGIALPPWLCRTPWIDVLTCPTVQHGFGGPSSFEFSNVAGQLSSPRGQRFWPLESFLLFW